MRSSDNLPHMGLTFANLEPDMPLLFLISYFECSVAELMASRNKVARRKGKGGGGDEVTLHFLLVIQMLKI